MAGSLIVYVLRSICILFGLYYFCKLWSSVIRYSSCFIPTKNPTQMDKLFEIDSFEGFEQVLHEIILNITYSATNASKKEVGMQLCDLKKAEEDVKKLITDNNFEMKIITETMIHKCWDRERIKYFVNLIEKKKTELLYASLHLHNSAYGETVTHSDWNLKLVLGTSELNIIKYPLLQVIMSTVDCSGLQDKKMFELNKDILMKTILALEQVTES